MRVAYPINPSVAVMPVVRAVYDFIEVLIELFQKFAGKGAEPFLWERRVGADKSRIHLKQSAGG